MPYYQRQAELNRSLEAYAQVYPHLDLRFFICDDGSDVPVRADGATISSLPKKEYGLNPCVPINIAVRSSNTDIVVLTNPEIVHTKPVFDQMIAALTDVNDYVMVGCKDTGNDRWLAGPLTEYGNHGRQPVPPGGHFHFCVMFHRALFDRVGGFDEAYRDGVACDDNDWLWTLHAAGAKFKYVDGVVWHRKTPHMRRGGTGSNVALLKRKWSHLW